MNSQDELRITTSRGFPGFLDAKRVSLAFTTYQRGRIFFLGLGPEGVPSAFGAAFSRCTGLSTSEDGRSLMLASEVQIYRFDNVLSPGESRGRHDALFAPHNSWITGDLDVHDLGIGTDELPIFASSLFNCVATVSSGYSFRPIWRPSFISRLVPEDRCHLNGIALENGRPRYVSCLSRTDIVDGWRDHRTDGGVVIDVASSEIVASGLSMPHSPRVHGDRLWLLNSGTGELGWIEVDTGRFNPIVFCPGFARGLTFVDDHAIVALSSTRDRALAGLELEDSLARYGVPARCGLIVVDLSSGTITDTVRIEGAIDELFDVTALYEFRCPSVLSLKRDDIRRLVTIDCREN